jgi:uncharacterized protein YggE
MEWLYNSKEAIQMAEFQKSLVRFLYVALGLAVIIAAFALTRPGPKPAPAQQAAFGDGRYGPSRGVTATGTCVVRTKPELVEVTIGVRQSSSTARAAKNYVKTTCGKISRFLTDNGVQQKDIQTQYFHLVSEWDHGADWQVKKWNAEEGLRVRIRNVDNVAEIIDGAVKSGANRVGNLSFTVDDVNKIRAKGREQAAKVARGKAQQLASSLGGKLGKLVSCNESYPGSGDGGYYGSYYNGFGYYDGNLSRAAQSNITMDAPAATTEGAEEVTIQPGELVTTVVVAATYEVE